MASTTTACRPLNLLSTRCLAIIHLAMPERVIKNVTWRILTGRIRHWDRLPAEILGESLSRAGLPVIGETSNEMGRIITFPNLFKLAQESKDHEVLSMLCENIGYHIREAAAINPKTPAKVRAKVFNKFA
ncbi:MAG: hypothetical protein NT030_04395 [Candidatus Saganbacteria bacterium]|nr:hypothetical protein [Candidatus Saganbacteria bacterium]